MKITSLKTVVVNAEMRNWVFVKVETDQPGLYGWGEASLEWKTRAVVGAVEDFEPMIVGEDPTRIEHLYQKMYRQSFWRLGVIGMSAISAIDQACWDILGKSLGQPVYRLPKRFPQDVPARLIDSGDRGHADDAKPPEGLAVHFLVKVLDAGRVFADNHRLEILHRADHRTGLPLERSLAPAV